MFFLLCWVLIFGQPLSLSLSPCQKLDSFDPFEVEAKIFRVCDIQCDQIWRNFATLAKSLKSWAILGDLFTIWQNFGPALASFVCHWANLRSFKWPNVEK